MAGVPVGVSYDYEVFNITISDPIMLIITIAMVQMTITVTMSVLGHL